MRETRKRFGNAPARVQLSLDRLTSALGKDLGDVKPGILLMRSRTLEADIGAYDSAEGRLELLPDALSVLKDLVASVEDLKGCFPQLAEIEATRLAQGLLDAGIDEAVHSMASMRDAAISSDIVAASAIAALKAGEPDVAHANEILREASDLSARATAVKKRAAIVGQMLLDYRNFAASVLREASSAVRRAPGVQTFAKAGADLKKVGAESWSEAVKAIPPAVGKGISKGVEDVTSAAIKTGVAGLVYSIGGWLGALALLAGSFAPLARRADEIKSDIEQSIEQETCESEAPEPDRKASR